MVAILKAKVSSSAIWDARTRAIIIYEIPGIILKGCVPSITFKPFTTTPHIVNSPMSQMRKIMSLNNLYKAGKQ